MLSPLNKYFFSKWISESSKTPIGRKIPCWSRIFIEHLRIFIRSIENWFEDRCLLIKKSMFNLQIKKKEWCIAISFKGGGRLLLDPSTAHEHATILLRSLSTRRVPFVFSSFQHDVRLAARDCSKITGLSAGRIVRESRTSRDLCACWMHRVSLCIPWQHRWEKSNNPFPSNPLMRITPKSPNRTKWSAFRRMKFKTFAN